VAIAASHPPTDAHGSTCLRDEARDPLSLGSQVTASAVRTVEQERAFEAAHHHRREVGWGKRAG
jgi:hypothetical protein